MEISSTPSSAIAVLSPYVNYRDLRQSLQTVGMSAAHVIRPNYRESLRWLEARIDDLREKVSLPLLFIYEDGELMLAQDVSSAEAALEKMVGSRPKPKWS